MKSSYQVCFVMLCVLCACTTSPTSLPMDGDGDNRPAETVVEPDIVRVQDLAPDEVSLVLPDVPPDVTEQVGEELPQLQCDPGEGCFLNQCEENLDCHSGWCVEHLGEGVCTQTCQEECPPGWKCKQVGGTDPDVIFICVSAFANLCKPCEDSSDCGSTGGVQDVCVSYGEEGAFCGGLCSTDTTCPWGFSCQETETVDGLKTTQCVNDAGVCPCTDKSVTLALWTPCENSTEWGTCTGKRVCTEEGLTECDAATATEEMCNGTDDDCDGETDEPGLVEGNYVNLCDDLNDCTEDKCMGLEGCVNLDLEFGPCDDGDPCTVADHCVQGLCVSDPVECEDDNPCTANVCTETGGCEFPPAPGACDDGDACTVADQCVDGTCGGTAVPCDCYTDEDCLPLEDNNLCNGTLYCEVTEPPFVCAVHPDTLIDCPEPEGPAAVCLAAHCAPATGDCGFVPAHDGYLCDDSDLCTSGSTCDQGTCSGGNEVNCNDGNHCTDDSCEPATGCVNQDNNVLCNDGDFCTTEDSCAGGICVGGTELVCNDGDICNGVESCDSVAGCQPGIPLVCDDGDICTGIESCDPDDGCQDGIPLVCNDDDACNGVESCDSVAGCQPGIPLVCDDGDICTGVESCDPDDGCQDGTPLVCNDDNVCTDDSCLAQAGCIFEPNVASCEDGNACTTSDVCGGGWCLAGPTAICGDQDGCTIDGCDPETGCTFTPITPCCGNGAVEDGEECDSGPDNSDEAPDTCRLDCVNPACGDSVIDAGESCDDGNQVPDDDCTHLCALPSCEDDIMNQGEIETDCGGPMCAPCSEDGLCSDNIDNDLDGEVDCDDPDCLPDPECCESAELDAMFGNGGIIMFDIGGGNDSANSVIQQPDGKLLISGGTEVNGQRRFFVARLNTDGSQDEDFGSSGLVYTAFGNWDSRANALALQPDGKIVAVGYGSTSCTDNGLTLARYTAAGILDQDFGSGGKVITDYNRAGCSLNSVAIQENGKIVVAGHLYNQANCSAGVMDSVVLRYESNGDQDVSFASSGKATFNMPGPHHDQARSVVMQLDGKFLVAAGDYYGGGQGFNVLRLNANGTLDGSFGSGGIAYAASGRIDSLALQTDGKIIASGESLVRLGTDGQLDVTFSGGIVSGMVSNGWNGGDWSVDIQANGSIVTTSHMTDEFWIGRYLSSGEIDADWGENGQLAIPVTGGTDRSSAILVQWDGKIVAVGYAPSDSNGDDIAVIRVCQ